MERSIFKDGILFNSEIADNMFQHWSSPLKVLY